MMGQFEYGRHLLLGQLILQLAVISVLSYEHDIVVNRPASNAALQGEKKFEDANFWRISAVDALSQKLKEKRQIAKAKNIIMFIGDGWDLQTMTASRIFKGQEVDNVEFGEEAKLHVESFPSTGFAKTYCVDAQVGDGSCTATALLGGVKVNSGTAGVTPNVKLNNCTAQRIVANQVTSILEWAQAEGKSTGIITTNTVTDSTPAPAYAHVANWEWECDADVSRFNQDPHTCDDIAEQLILHEPGKNIDVILGGGRKKFLPETDKDSEGLPGQRQDGKNLIQVWKGLKNMPSGTRRLNATYVENGSDLERVDASRTDALLGLFATQEMGYFDERKQNGQPTLKEMTEKAIQILSKNPKGFFLFVEGARIDDAHHQNWGQRALRETIEFDSAIQVGDDMTDDHDTLIVATSAHGHVMTIAGYADRGAEITGIAGFGTDNLPYATLGYPQGPGFKEFTNEKRYDISKDDLNSVTTRQVPLVPLPKSTHGGHDVQIMAKGPFSHLLSGVQEQNYIPYAMAYAACIGDGPTFCRDGYPLVGAHYGQHV